MNALARVSRGLQQRVGRQRLRKIVLGAIPFVALGTIWQMNAVHGWLAPIHVPPPKAVWHAIFALQDGCPGPIDALRQSPGCLLTNHILSSMGQVGLSLLVGLPLGVGLGVLAGMHRRLANALEPMGVFANAISGIAWVPLAIIWFGVGGLATLFILLNTVFWLVFFNTLLGVRGVPRAYEHGVLTLGATRWRVISQVYLPGALPSIVTGIRMSMGFGWRALIAAEMIGGDRGLGFMLFVSAQEYKTEEVFLGVLVIAVIWMLTDRACLVPLERWTIERWGLVWRPR
jgi:NitT/TauT family transport system permease protein/taurine transport system permease protein